MKWGGEWRAAEFDVQRIWKRNQERWRGRLRQRSERRRREGPFQPREKIGDEMTDILREVLIPLMLFVFRAAVQPLLFFSKLRASLHVFRL